MNHTCWIWQFDQIHSGNVPKLLLSQGFNRAAVKVLDGADWQGSFDKSTDGIRSIDDCISWLKAFNRAGLAMDVWVNATPTTPEIAALYDDLLLNLPGRLFIDLEPYRGFWGSKSSLAPLSAWLDSVRTNWASRVWLAPDSRLSNLDWYAPVLPFFGGFSPQIYAPAWRIDARSYAFPGPIEPILSIDGTPADWTAIARDDVLGNSYGMSGYGIWRAPVSLPEHIGWIQSH